MYVKIKHCFLLITEDTSLYSTVMLLNKVILPDKTKHKITNVFVRFKQIHYM